MKKKYYVYMHLYKDKVVYIGKGSVDCSRNISKGGYDRRAYSFGSKNRNERYLNFIKEVGKENIQVRIVARFDDEQDALWLEDELHEVHDNLYSLSTKELSNKKSKAIVQLDLDGQFVAEHKNAKCVVDIDSTNINRCCNKKMCTYKGYRWLFADEYYNGNFSFKQDDRINKRANSIILVYKDRIEKFNSIRECMRATDYKNVSNIAKGKYNHYSKKLDCYIYYEEKYLEMECGNLIA